MQKNLERHWPYVFGLLGPLAYFSVYALWIPILLILIIKCSHLVFVIRTDGLIFFRRYAFYFILPIFGLLSAIWAIVPLDAVSTAMKFVSYIFMAIFLGVAVKNANVREKNQIPLITASGFLLTYPIVILDVMLAGYISSTFKTSLYAVEIYSRGTAITACLLVPVALGLFRNNSKWFSIAFVLSSLGMIFGLNMEAAKLAIVCGVIIYFVVKWKPKAFWSLIILPILSFFVFPFIFLTPISDRDKCWLNEVHSSGLHRIMIYQFMTENIKEKPWVGWGMDASRSIPGGSTGVQSVECIKSDESRYILRMGGTKTLHPHNAGIQIWLELGLMGCLFLLFSICLLIFRMKEKIISDQGQAVLASTFYSICIIYGISFGLWQSWLMFSMILIASTILLLCSDHEKEPQNS